VIATIAVIAEHAKVRPDGKLDVTGVYNCRYVPELPAKLDVMLAMRFDVEPLDYGVSQNVSVHIMDEDGGEMVNLRSSGVSFDAPSVPGLPLAYDLLLPLTVGFPRDGTWTFDVRVNESTVARVGLRVEQSAKKTINDSTTWV
jgi:hypothetical protein